MRLAIMIKKDITNCLIALPSYGFTVAGELWLQRGSVECILAIGKSCSSVHPVGEVSKVAANRSSLYTAEWPDLCISQVEHLVSSPIGFPPKTWPVFKEEPRELCYLFWCTIGLFRHTNVCPDPMQHAELSNKHYSRVALWSGKIH